MKINEREIFLYAFRLGMRIDIEVLTEEYKRQRDKSSTEENLYATLCPLCPWVNIRSKAGSLPHASS